MATVNELTTGTFQYGVFANYYGLEQKLTEVYANIDGTLKQATDVLVNIDGVLASLPQVQSAYLKTTSDSMTLYGFTPSISGSYRIMQKKISGDHEIHLYSSDFTPLYDGYFYNQSFDLVAGTLYYITVTHYRGADIFTLFHRIFYKEILQQINQIKSGLVILHTSQPTRNGCILQSLIIYALRKSSAMPFRTALIPTSRFPLWKWL